VERILKPKPEPEITPEQEHDPAQNPAD
jgi:hypothetical protein